MASDDDVPDAPYGLLEDKWVKIQENTFTNWVNQQLRDTEYVVEKLDGKLPILISSGYAVPSWLYNCMTYAEPNFLLGIQVYILINFILQVNVMWYLFLCDFNLVRSLIYNVTGFQMSWYFIDQY